MLRLRSSPLESSSARIAATAPSSFACVRSAAVRAIRKPSSSAISAIRMPKPSRAYAAWLFHAFVTQTAKNAASMPPSPHALQVELRAGSLRRSVERPPELGDGAA